jgi:hypothetical protein
MSQFVVSKQIGYKWEVRKLPNGKQVWMKIRWQQDDLFENIVVKDIPFFTNKTK